MIIKAFEQRLCVQRYATESDVVLLHLQINAFIFELLLKKVNYLQKHVIWAQVKLHSIPLIVFWRTRDDSGGNLFELWAIHSFAIRQIENRHVVAIMLSIA